MLLISSHCDVLLHVLSSCCFRKAVRARQAACRLLGSFLASRIKMTLTTSPAMCESTWSNSTSSFVTGHGGAPLYACTSHASVTMASLSQQLSTGDCPVCLRLLRCKAFAGIAVSSQGRSARCKLVAHDHTSECCVRSSCGQSL